MSSAMVTVEPGERECVCVNYMTVCRTDTHAPFSLAPRATRASRLRAPAILASVPSNSVSNVPNNPVCTSNSSLI